MSDAAEESEQPRPAVPPAPPPPPPPLPQGGYGGPPLPPAPPPPAPGAAGKSVLPAVSLVLGICSIVVFCLGIPLGVAAIITGAMGRGRAKRSGSGAGAAVWGIITGIAGVVISVIAFVAMFATGFGIFAAMQEHYEVARQLENAKMAADVYYVDNNGTYEGLTTEKLIASGYMPSSDVSVTAVPTKLGTAYCVSGHLKSDPGNVIHMPPDPGSSITITANGRVYEYSLGGCPTS